MPMTVRPIDLGWWNWKTFHVCAIPSFAGAQVASQVSNLLWTEEFKLEPAGRCEHGNHWRVTRS